MKLVVFLFLFLMIENSVDAQTFNRTWSFTQLFGAEDTLEQTQLFFKINQSRDYYCKDQYTSGVFRSNFGNFRHFDTVTGSDSTFHFAYGLISPDCFDLGGSININDFHPFDNNFENYIFVGSYGDGFEPYGYSQIGAYDYYLAPLFDLFENVEANPYLGNYFFLPKYDDFTVRVPITQNPDTIEYINNYWYDIYYDSDVDTSILKTYDFKLLALSRFADSLAIIQKDGQTLRTEDFGQSMDTLDITIYSNSNIHFDADSIHIYALNEEMKLLISNNYGHTASWTEKQIPFDPLSLQVDTKTQGVLYGYHANVLYRSEDYGKNFNIHHQFEFDIIDYYIKPSSEVIYVLSSEYLYELAQDSLFPIRSIPTLDTIRIDFENLPYKSGNEFVFTVRKRVETSENYSKWVPIDEFHNTISINEGDITFNNEARHPFLDRITITEKNQLETNSFYFDGNWTLLTDSLVQYSTWESHLKEDSLYNLAAYGDPQYAYYDSEIVDKGVIINYFQNTDSTSKYGDNIVTAYWSPTLGFTRFFINAEEHFDIHLKGAIIDGIQYGDMEVIHYVSEEQEPQIPSTISLHQNYPNPFNPSTLISYELAKNSFVSLKVFDALGREVAALVDELKSAGRHQVTFDASGLASGVYYYVLNADEQIRTKKLTLIK